MTVTRDENFFVLVAVLVIIAATVGSSDCRREMEPRGKTSMVMAEQKDQKPYRGIVIIIPFYWFTWFVHLLVRDLCKTEDTQGLAHLFRIILLLDVRLSLSIEFRMRKKELSTIYTCTVRDLKQVLSYTCVCVCVTTPPQQHTGTQNHPLSLSLYYSLK